MLRPTFSVFIRPARAIALLALGVAAISAHAGPASQCFGSVSKGRLDGGVRLPVAGANFSAYSAQAIAAGRTHVHATVARIIADAYARAQVSAPSARYVYGETGMAGGGPFAPHKTHQNGLSVDFFVPVRDARGAAASLPSSAQNRFGYDIEFDAEGRYQDYRIDFSAYAEHLYQLDAAARAHGAALGLVIVDPRFMPALLATARGPWLRTHIPFMKGTPWVRHDEHFHVDFKLACAPLGAAPAGRRP
ncbi:penicillin-insensitive murein endopeptidase [Massilia violaceinigra]|uniref:Penicillin-insensitive murein endopeptidase n=1 Tax=Massilia violaceinigra TaxID=2045208 RepID=A0ABY4A4F8_9BURK|nr:penicillin-insensitive murein endopeptidase [Massilia violaceinigra]UOD28436.1 penicillin-insensitive murein endopeptidase [Massilia violaceinigra]